MKFILLFAAFFVMSAAALTPQTEPLVMPSDVSYLGSFALPGNINGTSRFGYGGHGVAPYHDLTTGKYTLFLEGHVQNPGQVAQVEIPVAFSRSTIYDALPVAAFLQPFTPIADGLSMEQATGTTTPNGVITYGMLAWGGRLIVSATEYYGSTQQASHWASGLNLSIMGDAVGFAPLAAAAQTNVRATSGPMAPVPAEWQSLLGGPALCGNWALPIVSGNSAGPAVSVFNPSDVGRTAPIPSLNLLFYPITATTNHALCAATCSSPTPEATQNNMFNLATHYAGMAFPAGSRSVLFFGRQGTGPYCYGTAADCGDPAEPDNKGPHAYPYQYQVWGFDANDLLAVKAGTKKPWEVKPYGTAAVPVLDPWRGVGRADVVGAGYDPETRRWFITTVYGEQPRVDVFQIRSL